MGCGTTLHVLRVSGWRQACSVNSGDETEKNCWDLYCTELVRREVTITETSHSLLSYKQAFDKNYDPRFIDVRVAGIVEGMMSSQFLAGNSRANCKSYVKVDKTMIKHWGTLTFSEKLDRDIPAAKTLRNTQIDDPSVYIFFIRTFLSWFRHQRRSSRTTTRLHNASDISFTGCLGPFLMIHIFATWSKTKTNNPIFPFLLISGFSKLNLSPLQSCHYRLRPYIFGYKAKKTSKRWKTNAELWERRFLQKAERHFSPMKKTPTVEVFWKRFPWRALCEERTYRKIRQELCAKRRNH